MIGHEWAARFWEDFKHSLLPVLASKILEEAVATVFRILAAVIAGSILYYLYNPWG